MLATNSAILSLLVSPILTLCLAGRDLALPILPNMTSLLGHLNQTAVGSPALNLSARGTPYCLALEGDPLNLESCENAWLKVPVDTDNHVFRHRNENPPAFTMYVISLLSTISV